MVVKTAKAPKYTTSNPERNHPNKDLLCCVLDAADAAAANRCSSWTFSSELFVPNLCQNSPWPNERIV